MPGVDGVQFSIAGNAPHVAFYEVELETLSFGFLRGVLEVLFAEILTDDVLESASRKLNRVAADAAAKIENLLFLLQIKRFDNKVDLSRRLLLRMSIETKALPVVIEKALPPLFIPVKMRIIFTGAPFIPRLVRFLFFYLIGFKSPLHYQPREGLSLPRTITSFSCGDPPKVPSPFGGNLKAAPQGSLVFFFFTVQIVFYVVNIRFFHISPYFGLTARSFCLEWLSVRGSLSNVPQASLSSRPARSNMARSSCREYMRILTSRLVVPRFVR